MTPKNWQIKKLGDVCELKSGVTIPKNLERVSGDILYVKVGDMNLSKNEAEITNSSRFVNSREIKQNQIIPNGAIIFPKRGGAIFTNKKRKIIKPTIVDLNTMAIIPGPKINNEYFYHWFKLVNLRDISNGANIPQINNYSFDEISIPFPESLKTQLKIVAILDDALGAVADAKLKAKANLQAAKDLFASELQSIFADPGVDWEERTLGDNNILQIVDGDRGKNYPTKKDFLSDGYCLFMNTKNVRPNGLEFKTKMFITQEKDQKMGKGKLKRRDVIMTTRGTIGNLGIYDKSIEYENVRINSGMLIFRPNEEKISSEFLFEILRSEVIKKQIINDVTGAAQPQLPIKTLIHFKFPLPPLKTQTQIVARLDALSDETKRLGAIYTAKIAALTELEKSLLQQAFSGGLTGEK
jgi:type I restriction enzyme, S subunit